MSNATLEKPIAAPTDPKMVLVLGLPFHQTTLKDALSDALIAIDGEESQYWVTPNLDFTTQAHDDDDLREILFYANRVLCDGMPIVWMSRMVGDPIPERVAGSDLVLKLLLRLIKKPIKFFFFGSDPATLKEATQVLESTYKNLEVVGAISPPHAAISDWDNAAYCEQIRAAEPDILLVALGCPKQERWMITYYQETGAKLTIGVGASLDFITGRQVRTAMDAKNRYGMVVAYVDGPTTLSQTLR